MPIKLKGATNGSVELNVPAAVGSDLQLTLPATAGEVIVKATNGSVDLGNVDITAAGAATFAGNVQTGTSGFSGPGATLESNGALNCNTGASGMTAITVRQNGTENVSIGNNGSATFKGQVTSILSNANSVCFKAEHTGSNAEAIQITNGSAATVRIRASGSVDFTSAFVKTTPAFASTAVFAIDENSSRKVSFAGNGTAVFAGSVTASNVSDIRFKENITDANPQLADAVALGSQLKNFDWKDEAPLNEELRAKRFLGLVAQEAEKVCPGLTYTVPRTKKGKELTPAELDDDGIEIKAATYEELDDSYKAINHDILVMKLLGAVAELSTKVAALEASS